MSNIDATPVTSTAASPVHHPALLNMNALQQRHHTLLQQVSNPRRTEVSELLHRHYEDKGLIDIWTSWCYDLSIWEKTRLSMSVISVAGLVGAVLGLAFPFIAIASGVLYAAFDLFQNQEQHRRDRGARFAEDVTALTEQLDRMMEEFQLIAADMTEALHQVSIQAQDMLNHNALITECTNEHQQEQATLQQIITAVDEQTKSSKKVQQEVLAVIKDSTSELHSIKPKLNEAAHAVDDFKKSIATFAETSSLMHQTETNLENISSELHNWVKHLSAPQPKPPRQLDPVVENAARSTQDLVKRARALHQVKQRHVDEELGTLSFGNSR